MSDLPHATIVANGDTPPFEMFIRDGRWWKEIWEQATFPNGAIVRRTHAFDAGKVASPGTPEYFFLMERFGP